MILHDFACDGCRVTSEDVPVAAGAVPLCPVCRGAMRIDWGHGKAPGTDVYGGPQTDRLGMIGEFTSEREREAKMKRLGFTRSPYADAHHGDREAPWEEKKRPRTRPDMNRVRRLSEREARERKRIQ